MHRVSHAGVRTAPSPADTLRDYAAEIVKTSSTFMVKSHLVDEAVKRLPLDDSVDDQPPFNIRVQGVVTRRRSGRRVPPAGHEVQMNRARPLLYYVDASS